MRRAIVYSDGYNHPFAESGAALCALACAAGWTVIAKDSIGSGLAELTPADLLIVNALRWSMTQHEKYAPDRDAWAFALPDGDMRRIEDHVASGGALLAVHTAVICWDNQPGWPKLLGGGWQWGVSHHPPLGPIRVTLTAEGRKRTAGAAEFEIADEAYHHLSPAADCTVLAEVDAGQGPQPVAWLRTVGSGRVGVDALGHDGASLRNQGHAALIAAMLDWLGGGD